MAKKVSKKLPKTVIVNSRNFTNLRKLPEDTVVRAYYVMANWKGAYYSTVTYKPGDTIYVTDWNTDPYMSCARGLHVATEKWCRDDSTNRPDRGKPRKWFHERLLLVEFKVSDIVCIPTYSNGKFRVKEFYVVKELKW